MIYTTFDVQCDGSSDDEDADYFCEAQFEHYDGPGDLGGLAQLHRQLRQRGWRAVRVPGGPTQVFCPLHPEVAAGSAPESGATP